ncbi:hypothetical protein [Haloferula helveola]
MHFRNASALFAALALSACGTNEILDVRPTHLRSLEVVDSDQPMIRGDQQRHFYGAIGVREQEQRLGHYYVVLWNEDSVGEPVRVVFEYQQASTASKIHRQVQEFDPSSDNGRAEFRITGDSYLEGGRVLAWKCSLFRGQREIASRHSYLWE